MVLVGVVRGVLRSVLAGVLGGVLVDGCARCLCQEVGGCVRRWGC